MTKSKIGVGLIGLEPKRSWAAMAHVPALRALSDSFEIVGVANRTRESADAAAAAYAIPRAFENAAELTSDPAVDLVVVTVKVPHHFGLVQRAIAAGKHVYCEWPLAGDLAQAREMTRLANEKGVLAVCGTQALGSPEIAYASQLVADGYVGQVLSTTIIGRGRGWGATIPLQQTAYVLDNRNGASMLTIPFGHTLAALREILGEVAEVGAILVNRRTEAKALDTGVVVPMTAHDQVLVAGLMASGAPLSMHYRGGDARDGKGLLWQINGAEGDLQLEAPSGHSQQAAFVLSGGRGSDKSIKPLATPPSLPEVGPADPLTGNVARIYARMASDLHTGTRTAPRFSDALEIHKIITAIEESARSGQRVRVE